MQCTKCGKEVNEKLNKVMATYKVPFCCEVCGSLNFPYQAILDKVFVFPDPVPEEVKGILIPEVCRDNFQNEYGMVVSVGNGYVDKETKKFIPTTLKVGDRVAYDKNIMWQLPVRIDAGKTHIIKFMTELDIQFILEED